jgi:ATP adenylyltransferase
MKKLWAPWRLQYIKIAEQINEEGCIFCDFPAENKKNDRKNLILYRSKSGFIMMNKYPYNNAHLMVVPYQHTDTLETLSAEERLELMNLLQKAKAALQETCFPHGFNIGMNLGRVAGAGIDEHIHFHIVPRWNGDTNFMPIIGGTKVISAGLEATWDSLYPLLNK